MTYAKQKLMIIGLLLFFQSPLFGTVDYMLTSSIDDQGTNSRLGNTNVARAFKFQNMGFLYEWQLLGQSDNGQTLRITPGPTGGDGFSVRGFELIDRLGRRNQGTAVVEVNGEELTDYRVDGLLEFTHESVTESTVLPPTGVPMSYMIDLSIFAPESSDTPAHRLQATGEGVGYFTFQPNVAPLFFGGLRAFEYVLGPPSGSNAVPEPSSFLIWFGMALGVALVAVRRYKSHR